jgi:hypothetical protein
MQKDHNTQNNKGNDQLLNTKPQALLSLEGGVVGNTDLPGLFLPV